MNAGHFEQVSDCWSSEEQPATYYRTAAARARRLQADATTPRVKQYLDKMIVHCERLAGKVEQPASCPLDRPGRVDKPRGEIRPSARAISNYRVDPISRAGRRQSWAMRPVVEVATVRTMRSRSLLARR
jgi:hypothetical protein